MEAVSVTVSPLQMVLSPLMVTVPATGLLTLTVCDAVAVAVQAPTVAVAVIEYEVVSDGLTVIELPEVPSFQI